LLPLLKWEPWHADFVYSEYLTAVGTRFRPVIFQIAEDYSKADLLLRLPGYCPMPAFREVIDVPLVARVARKTASQVPPTARCHPSSLPQPAVGPKEKLASMRVLAASQRNLHSKHVARDPCTHYCPFSQGVLVIIPPPFPP